MEKEKSICFSLKRVNHIVERGIHTSLAAAGFDEITNMHGWILGFLYHAQRPVYQKDIESNFGIARSTVTNILQLMEKKGYLTHESVGRGYLYSPVVRREDYGHRKLGKVVKNFFSGSYLNVVNTFVRESNVSREELEQLIEELKRQEQK